MRLFYNEVELKVLSTLPGTKRVVVRDRSGLHYLYTKWIFDVICLYNPAATTTAGAGLAASFALAPQVPTPGPLGQGSPAFTDSRLRDLLRQDRRQLLVFSEDGQYILQSPQPAGAPAAPVPFATLNPTTGRVTITEPTMECDATGGPRVTKCDIVEAHGIKSYTIHFQVETDVCEWQGTELLSHAWNVRLSTDQDGMATRLIEGELKFRVDELLRLRRIPDNYRAFFGHPVPDYFARTSVDVFDHEDGCTVSYQVTDTQRHFNLGADSPATRFEAFLTGSMEKPGPLANNLRIGAGVVERLVGIGGTYATGRVTGRPTAIAATLVDVGTNLLNATVRLALENCPKYQHGCVVRAWGPTFIQRNALMAMCIGIAYGRLGTAADGWRTEALKITHELSGKFVEVELLFSSGLEDISIPEVLASLNPVGSGVFNFGFDLGKQAAQLFQNVVAPVAGGKPAPGVNADVLPPKAGPSAKLLAPFIFRSEELKDGFSGVVRASQTTLTKNRPLPYVGGTSGSWLGQLVAQVLYDGASAPPDVPGPVVWPLTEFVDPVTGAITASGP